MATTRKLLVRMPASLRDAAVECVSPFGGSVSALMRVRLAVFQERLDGDVPTDAPSLAELGLPETDNVVVSSRVDEGLLASIEARIAPYGGDVKAVVVDEFARFVQEERERRAAQAVAS